jgi:hypothetical protein
MRVGPIAWHGARGDIATAVAAAGDAAAPDHSGRPALRRPSMNRSNSLLSKYESHR